MNDPELNRKLAETQFPSDGWDIYKDDPGYPEILYVRYKDSSRYSSHYKQINYLNNWSDLMPLVVKYGLSLRFIHDSDLSMCWKAYKGIVIINKSPQRALAECLLKVLTQEKQNVN